MANVLKNFTFIGKKPLKVYNKYTEMQPQAVRTIKAMNTYLSRLGKTTNIPELNISYFGGTQIDYDAPVVQLSEDEIYLPLSLSFRTTLYNKSTRAYRNATLIPKALFYVKAMRRPNEEFIRDRLIETLSSEYGGAFEFGLNQAGNSDDRYIMCLQNANSSFLDTLLRIAVSGDGSVIDYTWIAPLQELVEMKEDKPTKVKQNAKTFVVPPIHDDFSPDHELSVPEPWAQHVGAPRAKLMLDKLKQDKKRVFGFGSGGPKMGGIPGVNPPY